MRALGILCLVLTLLNMNSLSAQDFSDYTWKNRLILIYPDQEESKRYQEQINELSIDVKALEERKLKVFEVKKGSICEILPQRKSPQKLENQSLAFATNNQRFRVVLIGLDGGVKLRRSTIVGRDYLFALIDGMPMRRAEIRQKNEE